MREAWRETRAHLQSMRSTMEGKALNREKQSIGSAISDSKVRYYY